MAPTGTSTLRAHLNMHPLSRLYGSTPPRPIIVNAGRGTPLHLRATSIQRLLQNDAPSGEKALCVTIIRSGDPDVGFPPEQPMDKNENCRNNAFNKIAMNTAPSSAMTKVKLGFYRQLRLAIGN
jgi:hypothetical protein